MRPCNQCRRPVDNDVLICQDCIEQNELTGGNGQANQTVRANTSAPISGTRKPTDLRDEDGKLSLKSKLVLLAVFLTPVILAALVGGVFSNSIGGYAGGAFVGAILGCRLLELLLN